LLQSVVIVHGEWLAWNDKNQQIIGNETRTAWSNEATTGPRVAELSTKNILKINRQIHAVMFTDVVMIAFTEND